MAAPVVAAFGGKYLARGGKKAGPCGPRERAADADAAHAEVADLLKGEIAGPTHEKVHGFGRDGGDYGPDVVGGADSGGIQAIGAGVGVGFEALDGEVDIGLPDEEALGAADQQGIAAGLVDGFAGGADSVDSGVEIVQGL